MRRLTLTVGGTIPWAGIPMEMGFEDWLCYRKFFLYYPDSTNVVYHKSPSKKKRVVRREDLQQFICRVSLVNGLSPFNDTRFAPFSSSA